MKAILNTLVFGIALLIGTLVGLLFDFAYAYYVVKLLLGALVAN